MVDFGADRGVAFVWTTRNVGGVSFGTRLNNASAWRSALQRRDACHATLTDWRTTGVRWRRRWARVLREGEDQRHIAIDGKTMRASKDGDGHATHVLSAFCAVCNPSRQ